MIILQYGEENIVCPFYIEQSKNTIKCEGIISVTCNNNFSTAVEKREHQLRTCCNNYRSCAVYRILDLKY